MADDGDNGPEPYAAYLRVIIQKGLIGGQPPVVTTNPNLLEAQAKRAMTKAGFDYIVGGAGESATMDANRLAFRQWKIVPRVLKPTSPRDLSITVFGQKYGEIMADDVKDVPVLMAPVGVNSIFHEDKEIGVAQACADLGVPYTLSTASSTSFEDIATATPGSPKWYQLYWPNDDEITALLLRRAKDNGFTALVVTLDTWTLAWRPHDLDTLMRKFGEVNGEKTPESSLIQASIYWVSEIFSGGSRSWEELTMLKTHWDGPVVLKGILSAEDAKLAVEHGMDGVIISNHGGRQLDGAVSTLDVLSDIVQAFGDKLTVMIDSGIRTGADIVKALALGAKAVFVGRPVAYGLGIGGGEGAKAVLAGLLADLDLTMGMTGAQKISDLQRVTVR